MRRQSMVRVSSADLGPMTSPGRRRSTIDGMHSPSTSGEITTPVSIHADRAAGSLSIAWGDGHQTVYEMLPLRWLCPCAYCRGEAGLPGWLDSAPVLTDEQIRLTDVSMIGGYAIAPHWGDGHHTGYYTFTMLREHCPCTECAGRRAGHAPVPSVMDRHEEHA